jgi:hypothetical protein
MANRMKDHLDRDRIIRAVVDAGSLGSEGRRHLVECPECRAEKSALERNLALFGELSREKAPATELRPGLIFAESRRYRPDRILRPALGMGVLVASLLVLLLNPYFFKPKKDAGLERIYTEMIQDAKFMAEIDKLTSDDPLPRFYSDIADFADQDAADEHGGNNRPVSGVTN